MTTNMTRLAFASILALLTLTDAAIAQRGGRGGMVGRGGGGGGGNFSRPNVGRPEMPRPEFNRPANVNQNFNRPANVNQNFNRPINANNNNFNRENFNRNNNVQINNNINNLNRGPYNGYGYGHGVGSGYGGWGGYGGYGSGYYGHAYYGAHPGWVNGAWGGNFYPGWGGNGGYGGYYGNNFGSNVLGIGAGLGIAAWGMGSLLNNWGYSSYANPYYGSGLGTGYVQQPANFGQQLPYDYSRPLDLASTPPPDNVMQTAETSLDSARQAFRAGDYVQALALADQALVQTPNDPILHEFRATCLFAMQRYDEAAVPYYTVLSSGPGWDWTTQIGLYPDVETYTAQLRALEAYCKATARAASARFVLAALYLTQGSTAAAATQLKEVVAIQPQDKLSSQILEAINAQNQPGQANAAQAVNPVSPDQVNPVQPTVADAAPVNPTPAQTPALPTGPVPANLVGTWNASPSANVTITLSFTNDRAYNWKVLEKGQAREFKGEASFDKDVLSLVAPQMPPMVAKVTWKDPAHFNFKAVATPAEDPGLNFAK